VSAPVPTGEACPLCGAPLDPAQEWCLRCGAAARTRLAASPNWKAPLWAVALVVALSLGVLAAALVKLAGGSGTTASAPPTRTVTVPAAALPTTPTTPGAGVPGTSTPGSGIPGTSAPGGKTPGTIPPGATLSKRTPGTSLPGATTPSTTVPGTINPRPGASGTTSSPGLGRTSTSIRKRLEAFERERRRAAEERLRKLGLSTGKHK
jgi:hypothetical protein